MPEETMTCCEYMGDSIVCTMDAVDLSQLPPITFMPASHFYQTPFVYMPDFDSKLYKICSEEDVRTRAYYLWEAAGRPEGDGTDFWYQAQNEIECHG